jgi:hypothetical protein
MPSTRTTVRKGSKVVVREVAVKLVAVVVVVVLEVKRLGVLQTVLPVVDPAKV